MEALLLCMILGAIVGTGDRPQLLAVILVNRAPSHGGVVLGAVIATAINCLISGLAGVLIGNLLNERAAMMMLALALFFAAFGMIGARFFSRTRTIDRFKTWHMSSFTHALLGFGAVEAGDKTQFIIFAAAALSGSAAGAAIGGFIGAFLPIMLALVMGAEISRLPITRLRSLLGWLMFLPAIWTLLKALQIIA